jgi:hypothetical protein
VSSPTWMTISMPLTSSESVAGSMNLNDACITGSEDILTHRIDGHPVSYEALGEYWIGNLVERNNDPRQGRNYPQRARRLAI